jgi:hypothetical protein
VLVRSIVLVTWFAARNATRSRSGLVLLLALAWHGTTTSAAAAAATAVATPAPRGSLEARVQTLTKALDLDPRQQAGLRNILQSQRDQVMQVWNDTSVPAAYRISATQAISEQTADRIRALLNEEQKKKYNPPKPQHQPPTDSSGRSVEDWLRAANPAPTSLPLSGVTAAE